MRDPSDVSVEAVRTLARTYQDLCHAWWDHLPPTGFIQDPPHLEVRLALTLYAASVHRSILPTGFEEWLEDRAIRMASEYGEEAASLLVAAYTNEAMFISAGISSGGDA